MTTVLHEVPLGEVASFIRGITFKPSDVVPVETPGVVRCMRTKNVQAHLDLSDVWAVSATLVKRPEQFLQAGDILVSSANSWNLVGKCCWIPQLDSPSSFGGFVSVLRANSSKVDSRYLYHWFSSSRIQATLRSFGQQTTSISNLNIDRCLKLSLPLPPLEKQRQIAEMLDRAHGLRAKHRESLVHLDDLTQSIFLDMFGDPVDNKFGWPSGAVRDFVARFETGKNLVAEDEDDQRAKFRVLKVSAVTSLTFNGRESKAVPRDYQPPSSHLVRHEDLLFSRANTEALIGATALVVNPPNNLLLPDKIWRFVWREPAKSSPLYVRQLFQQRSFRSQIRRRATGTSGSMKNISQDKVMAISIGVPPISLQCAFADRAAEVERLKTVHQASLTELDALFASLQDRAFRGLL
ncbi:restriction endonuclease subunit S [Micromonospora rifamycinica]|uniref:restriction endonuclease subunit S n=1 Tax=Micromonospora rifamycinica TaxID=291594 RepID=UPI002E2C6F7B|nr:restriction endonuclease subunit S [Micromonospora rifamycinica]